MTGLAWAAVLFGCRAAHIPPPAAALEAVDLYGQWRVEASTFPMWLEGPRRCPVLAYSPGEAPETITDQVHFLRGGEPGIISGTDTRDPSDPLHLTWRGDGWMKVLRSDWYIRAAGPGWLIIYFERTTLTPSGMDVLETGEGAADGAAIDAAIAADPILAALADALEDVDRTGCP